MPMNPPLRRLMLAVHVATSVGWLGAVAAFLVLSLAGLSALDGERIRACYLAMDLIGRYLIVPLSAMALASGLIQSLGTQWGLFHHYWVAAKFGLTVAATIGLLVHQFTAVAAAADRASRLAPELLRDPALQGLGQQLALDAALAIAVLLTTTALSVYKPWGPIGETRSFRVALWALAAMTLTFVIVHLAGGGLGHH